MSSQTQPHDEFVVRMAAGAMTGDDVERLRKGAIAFLNAEGQLRLDVCLLVPTAAAAIAKACRNYWVRRAFSGMSTNGRWLRAVELSQQLGTFIERGPFRFWRGLDDPPAGADDATCALFHIARLNCGHGLSADQIRRIVSAE